MTHAFVKKATKIGMPFFFSLSLTATQPLFSDTCEQEARLLETAAVVLNDPFDLPKKPFTWTSFPRVIDEVIPTPRQAQEIADDQASTQNLNEYFQQYQHEIAQFDLPKKLFTWTSFPRIIDEVMPTPREVQEIAQNEKTTECLDDEGQPPVHCLIQFRAARFFYASRTFRNVYGLSGTNYQVEAGFPITRSFEAWTNVDSSYKNKKRHDYYHFRTQVWIKTISLGLKFVQPLSHFCDLYLGLGAAYGRVTIKNQIHVKNRRAWEKKSKNGIGAVFKLGARYSLTETIFVDLFADYLIQRVHYARHVEVGGLKVGIGIGLKM